VHRATAVPLRLGGTPVIAFWTDSSNGDQRPVVEGRAQPPSVVLSDARVVGLSQVHGGEVVSVGAESARALAEGDAALATDDTTCAAILVADCVPIAIGSPEGVRVAVHAGWRGLVAGVVENAATAARAAGASSLVAGVGPCIGPCCYEFSPDDLETVESALGFSVRAKTDRGAPALDLRRAALGALRTAGVDVCFQELSCTSCSPGWFSARARADTDRQALYLWRSPRSPRA
jgi:polyphenol oxidase